MDIAAENAALHRAVICLAHALRLNTTLPTGDGEAWPECPWSVMQRCHEMMAPLALRSSAVCAALVILDERTQDDLLVDQDALLKRITRLSAD